MDATLPLHTERLALREFEERDWTAVHRYAADPEVVRFMQWGPNAEAETQGFVARAIAAQAAQPRTGYELAIVRAADGQLIGSGGLRLADAQARSGSIGYCLARPFWGRGYATEAAKALLGLAFDSLGLHRVWAACDVENAASARVLQKAGLIREGRLREHKWVKGRWRDSLLFALLDREWDRLQTAHIPCPAAATGAAGAT
ncbi:MAG: GNAT family N-acetyltransferase [Candidatus Brocadiia bacterium]